jgi:hypothetical protein
MHAIFRTGAAAAAMLAMAAPTAALASPLSVRKMDAVAIQSIKESKLCDAYAVWASQGRHYPVIDGELKRRGIDCAYALETVVSNCSMLQVIAVENPFPGGVIYTVRNGSQKRKAFRIYGEGIVSSRLVIGPGATQDFGVRTDPRIASIGRVGAQLQGDAATELTECLTATW